MPRYDDLAVAVSITAQFFGDGTQVLWLSAPLSLSISSIIVARASVIRREENMYFWDQSGDRESVTGFDAATAFCNSIDICVVPALEN